MSGLTSHVLDLMHGGAAVGVRIDFSRFDGADYQHVATMHTNASGRTDAPFLDAAAMAVGRYELVFHVGDYFAAKGIGACSSGALPVPPFIDRVPVRFAIARPDEHYHVPLLVAPWGYSTYRGS